MSTARRHGQPDGGGGGLNVSDYGDANALNQLTSRTVPGRVWVSGEAPVTLTLQGLVARSLDLVELVDVMRVSAS
jgi:hypothetical protein